MREAQTRDYNLALPNPNKITGLAAIVIPEISASCGTLHSMQLCGVFLALGQDVFRQLVRGISIGKLKTYQVYERFKLRTHLTKLNADALRKAEPRLWARIEAGEEDFAGDMAQVSPFPFTDDRRCPGLSEDPAPGRFF